MFRKLSLATAAAAATLTMVPAAAEARHRDGYYDSGRYQQSYRGRSGTTGAILGGAVGALAGRAIQKSSCR